MERSGEMTQSVVGDELAQESEDMIAYVSVTSFLVMTIIMLAIASV